MIIIHAKFDQDLSTSNYENGLCQKSKRNKFFINFLLHLFILDQCKIIFANQQRIEF